MARSGTMAGHGFVRGVVHNRQALDDASFGRPVEHEFHRPDLVGGQRPPQRLPIRYRHVLAPSLPHLQARLGIEPVDVLVIDQLPGLPQLQIDHASTIAAVPVRH